MAQNYTNTNHSIKGQPEIGKAQFSSLAAEEFLQENYELRRNQLSGKVEFRNRQPEGNPFRALTKEAQNSIVLRAMREDILDGDNPKSSIDLILHSEDIPVFNPVTEFIDTLPQWDGRNHVASLFQRLPGVTSEQLHFLSIWMHSVVAHWMQMDTLHGNECVPTLIGSQGCGKTTFFTRLLPKELRLYFMDNINLSNRFDKEMALINNLLVNLDELDSIRPSQHASLKQTLSKSKVNGRPIYGASQEDRPRFASFTATTNNRHPLTDVTGSRRYICVEIPQGKFIDNAGEIDYPQLYAQLKYELVEQKMPYWFTNDEVARLQELNLDYMAQTSLPDMVDCCFRKPAESEVPSKMSIRELLNVIVGEFPSVQRSQNTTVQLGILMTSLGYQTKMLHGQKQYEVMLKNAA